MKRGLKAKIKLGRRINYINFSMKRGLKEVAVTVTVTPKNAYLDEKRIERRS